MTSNDTPVARLREQIEQLPRRVEQLGGQQTSYVQLDNVLALVEAPSPEPNVEALIDRAGDWQARMFNYEVAGCIPTVFEREAVRLMADLMLCVATGGGAPVSPAEPTPDMVQKGDDARVKRLVADIRGAFATTRGDNPVFFKMINVEEVVRFVLLRATSGGALPSAEVIWAVALDHAEHAIAAISAATKSEAYAHGLADAAEAIRNLPLPPDVGGGAPVSPAEPTCGIPDHICGICYHQFDQCSYCAPIEAERTVKSLATMLGWVNTPPQRVLEADVSAILARIKSWRSWVPFVWSGPREGSDDDLRAAICKQFDEAEERATQAERELEAQLETQQAMIESNDANFRRAEEAEARIAQLEQAATTLVRQWREEAKKCGKNCVRQRGDGQMANSGFCLAFMECAEGLAALVRARPETEKEF